MINLLIINMGQNYGGTEKNIEDIVRLLDKKTFNIIVVGRRKTKFVDMISKFNDIEVISIELSRIRILFAIKELKKIVKKYDVDIVHAHGITSLLLSIFMKKSSKIVTTTHGYSNYDRMDRGWIEKTIFSNLERYLLKKVDYCIAVSNDIKKYIKEAGVVDEKISVINHGISIKDINKKGSDFNDNDIIKIGSVGRLEKVKGYDSLIDALEICYRKIGYKFICEIAGDGKEKENLNLMIEKKNMGKICRLVGFVEDVYSFNKSLDIYVQPSLIESFGISIIEAMSMAIPVIATNSGGVKDFITDNVNGMKCSAGNKKELAEKILYLIDNPKERRKIGNEARDYVVNNFKKEDKVKEIEDVYKFVLNI